MNHEIVPAEEAGESGLGVAQGHAVAAAETEASQPADGFSHGVGDRSGGEYGQNGDVAVQPFGGKRLQRQDQPGNDQAGDKGCAGHCEGIALALHQPCDHSRCRDANRQQQ